MLEESVPEERARAEHQASDGGRWFTGSRTAGTRDGKPGEATRGRRGRTLSKGPLAGGGDRPAWLGETGKRDPASTSDPDRLWTDHGARAGAVLDRGGQGALTTSRAPPIHADADGRPERPTCAKCRSRSPGGGRGGRRADAKHHALVHIYPRRLRRGVEGVSRKVSQLLEALVVWLVGRGCVAGSSLGSCCTVQAGATRTTATRRSPVASCARAWRGDGVRRIARARQGRVNPAAATGRQAGLGSMEARRPAETVFWRAGARGDRGVSRPGRGPRNWWSESIGEAREGSSRGREAGDSRWRVGRPGGGGRGAVDGGLILNGGRGPGWTRPGQKE